MNNQNDTHILTDLFELPLKPGLFEEGKALFWNDPHISQSMLEAHLNPDNDAASRKHTSIDAEVNHLVSTGFINPGDTLLDLGCGPGLYSSRLAAGGVRVTGIDISNNSLEYARRYAEKNDLAIEYRLLNFFEIDSSAKFDVVLQVNGELNVFSNDMRDDLLARLRKALKPGGYLIFDVTTRVTREKYGQKTGWYISDGGFWRPGKHVVLERGIDYPEENVWLDQTIVIDSVGVKVYNNWFHDYDLETITGVLIAAGFEVVEARDDLAGNEYSGKGEWIALVAQKNE